MASKHYDIIIIGAGISGVGMACHLSQRCPDKHIAILERRNSIGGTWDLFRYPGIRSDSDMVTFGYKFRPWTDSRILAGGSAIRRYTEETAQQFGVDHKTHFGIKTSHADWSSSERKWTISGHHESSGEECTFTCSFLVSATGYYNHDQGFLPSFPGAETYKGQCIHPQHWPDDLSYKDKRVVVIGSGATAMTLIPAMAKDTQHITMLQRSPTYVYSVPAIDRLGSVLKYFLPTGWVYLLTRERNIRLQRAIYKFSRSYPKVMRKFLLNSVRKQVGPDFDMTHFTPKYMPWDERLCAVPDGDLFQVLRSGKASVVTDHIDRFTETGIRLKSGKELEADIIITATGLQLQTLGGMTLSLDGESIPVNTLVTYKGVLVQNIPNMAFLFGYTNISWTLKIDMAAEYVCRLITTMSQRGAAVVTPRAPKDEALDDSILGSIQAGYVQRSGSTLPRQGRTAPWQVTHHFESDREMYKQPIDDAALEWSSKA